MIDAKFIIENKLDVKNKLSSRGEKLDFCQLEDLYKERKKLILKTEEISSIRNKASKEIGQSKGKPSKDLIQQMKSFGLELSKKSEKLKKTAARVFDIEVLPR